jgi:hypothetical protein
METSQFEAKKIALKQTKDGHVLTLAIHPDESPDEILRDFVGARYMVVMVRLGDEEKPLNREEYAGTQMVKLAGMLCRDSEFWDYLCDQALMFEANEGTCISWLKSYLNIASRAELKTNLAAQKALKLLHAEYKEWKND